MRARAFEYSSCRARRSILAVSVKGKAKKRKKVCPQRRISGAESEVAARSSAPEKEQGIKGKSRPQRTERGESAGEGFCIFVMPCAADRYLPLSAKGIAKKRKKVCPQRRISGAESEVAARNSTPEKEQGIKEKSRPQRTERGESAGEGF